VKEPIHIMSVLSSYFILLVYSRWELIQNL